NATRSISPWTMMSFPVSLTRNLLQRLFCDCASIGGRMVAVCASAIASAPIPRQVEYQRYHTGHRQADRQTNRGGVAESKVTVLEGCLVDVEANRFGRVLRAALGDDQHRLRHADDAGQEQRDYHGKGRLQQRHRNESELLPAVSAVQ